MVEKQGCRSACQTTSSCTTLCVAGHSICHSCHPKSLTLVTHSVTLVTPRPSGSLTCSQARNGPFRLRALHLLTSVRQVLQLLLHLSPSPCNGVNQRSCIYSLHYMPPCLKCHRGVCMSLFYQRTIVHVILCVCTCSCSLPTPPTNPVEPLLQHVSMVCINPCSSSSSM